MVRRLTLRPAKAITLGFRPEDADVIFGAEAPSGAFVLPAIVEAAEPVGAESFLHCAAGGQPHRRACGRSCNSQAR